MNLLCDYKLKKDVLGNCLSTTIRTNGAVAIFLPGVAVRTCEIHMGIPKRLLWRGFGRGGKTQDRQTYRQCPSVLHGGSNILKVIR